jgi:hypothetical protein
MFVCFRKVKILYALPGGGTMAGGKGSGHAHWCRAKDVAHGWQTESIRLVSVLLVWLIGPARVHVSKLNHKIIFCSIGHIRIRCSLRS